MALKAGKLPVNGSGTFNIVTSKSSFMENETNTVEEVAGTLLPVPWITWNIEFNKLLSKEEIPGEIPLIQNFLDDHLSRFLDIKPVKGKKLFKYRWSPKQKGSRTYKLEIFSIMDFTFSICREENKYVILRKDILFRGSDKNTIKLKPPEL
jgi:hypothetical protein